jgi:hypothetical protein
MSEQQQKPKSFMEELDEWCQLNVIEPLYAVWGIRAKAVAIPGCTRSAFRDDSDHRSGLKAIIDSDGKPITKWPIPES